MSSNLRFPMQQAQIAWNKDNKPQCLRHDDIYFSTDNEINESRYVFLQANDLPRRWQHFIDNTYVIAETGFGTGLNFLLTWQAWNANPHKPDRLHYISTEKFPLCKADFCKVFKGWPELSEYSSELLNHYPILTTGPHRLVLAGGQITLDLLLGDAKKQLEIYWDNHWSSGKKISVHSWYLDGFAPSKNPDIWTPELFSQMALMSNKETQFSTFTAASVIRRELEDHGFIVKKIPGFGKKREMLKGTFSGRSGKIQDREWSVPWHIDSQSHPQNRHAIIVGAGLAGCTSAEALIRKGWNITIIEQHNNIASEASGNSQAALYSKLSHRLSTLSEYTLQSYLYSLDYYKNKFLQKELQHNLDGSLCGVLQLFRDSSEKIHPQLKNFLDNTEGLAQLVKKGNSSKETGFDDIGPGLFFPGAGWISPASLCKKICEHPKLKLITNSRLASIRQVNDCWQVLSENGRVICTSSVLIIAGGVDCNKFEQLKWLPLHKIRGQTSLLASNSYSNQLKTVLCHQGYIAPQISGQHCIGATFDRNDNELDLRHKDHIKNLDQLAKVAPQLDNSFRKDNQNPMGGRVGFRCASPDYLPLVGPVPDTKKFDINYADLRKDARKPIDTEGSYLDGLYINTGHGSSGLTSSPWCGEFLASLICNEPLPTSKEISRALLPARFLIRDLSRNKR